MLRPASRATGYAAQEPRISVWLTRLVTHIAPAERAALARAAWNGTVDMNVDSLLGRALAQRVVLELSGLRPTQVRFAIGQNGKPHAVSRATGENAPCFSITHAGRWIGVAVASQGRVGVDLEPVAPFAPTVSARVFAESDRKAVGQLPECEQDRAFTKLWTVAEACAKVDGNGLPAMLRAPPPIGLSATGKRAAHYWAVGVLSCGVVVAVAADRVQDPARSLAQARVVDLGWILKERR